MPQADSDNPHFARHTRYQGAIVRDHHVLLIKERERSTGRSFWFFPGGGIELGETAEDCVKREMKEETNLDVKVKRPLLDGPELHRWSPYKQHLTYLCEPTGGVPRPGSEGKEGHFTLEDVTWVDLRDEGGWPAEVSKDESTRHFLRLIREKLGYMPAIRLSGDTRYQAAIVRDHRILLVKHREDGSGRTYWIFPGGGIEKGETEEDCVRREMREETSLEVSVVRVLLDEVADGRIRRQWMKTYLCEPLTGIPRPGAEPEGYNSIVEVKWFDLHSEENWDNDMSLDPFTYPLLQRVRKILRYLP